ncbi:uncharacterized protein [Populus alba]|uniref:uncharacterized protein n=1 Tax=Populus alba TaxID=43335 RepID=UPI003CC6EF32
MSNSIDVRWMLLSGKIASPENKLLLSRALSIFQFQSSKKSAGISLWNLFLSFLEMVFLLCKNSTLAVMCKECFDPIVDSTIGRDLIPLMVYGKNSRAKIMEECTAQNKTKIFIFFQSFTIYRTRTNRNPQVCDGSVNGFLTENKYVNGSFTDCFNFYFVITVFMNGSFII